MSRRPNGKGDRLDRLVSWVESKGRVTVADHCERSGQASQVAVKRLMDAVRAGALITEGGGRGEALYFRKPE